ncbi:uncharacterized protein LOC134206364 [Armigeres subalbatus]|uniref:uncharacterized protein LOC134206364 n=1 Tax=Armigeres subalbatus TaxID=124917 RepID=UPI002ED16D3E
MPSVGELQERLFKLSELCEQFDKVQVEMEEQYDALEEISSIFNHRVEFEEMYYDVKERYITLLGVPKPHGSSEGTIVDPTDDLKEAMKLLLDSQRMLMTSQAAAQNTVSQLAGQVGSVNLSRPFADAQTSGGQFPFEVRLPTISLPVFKGDRKQWASFKDLYESCIHSRNIKDSVKLQYLLSHLDGEAKKLVSAFTVTDANYVEVWDRLNEFYDKKKYTVAALIKEFFDQPPITTPSLVGLRKLVSTSDEVVRQLKALGEEYESRDPWLIHLLLEKLDRETRSLWAQKLVEEDFPSFNDFVTFLERRCDAMETCASFSRKGGETTIKKDLDRKADQNMRPNKVIQSFHAITQLSCPQCAEAHTIYQCASFKGMSVHDRRELIQRAKLCFNCMKATHIVKNCTSAGVCKQCKQKHHSLLCTIGTSDSGQLREKTAAAKNQQTTKSEEPKQADSVASYVTDLKPNCSLNFLSLLPTASIKVLGKNGVFHEARAMVDSACMNSLISKQAFERLGLERRNASILVSGITDGKSSKTSGAVTLQISSRFDDRIIIVVEALILNHLVSDQPSQQFDIDTSALAEAPLADPDYNKRGKIDLLLGIEALFSILESCTTIKAFRLHKILSSAIWSVANSKHYPPPAVARCSA